MMSNCAFWSSSGDLVAVHGSGPADPRGSFEAWARQRRLPPGRLVDLGPDFPRALLPDAAPGWQRVGTEERRRRSGARPDTQAAVASPGPLLDRAPFAWLPRRLVHDKFALSAVPTWTLSPRAEEGEGPAGWYAALPEGTQTSRFLLRLLPFRGRLPGEGWRNMLAFAVKAHAGLRLVPLNGLPTAEALAAAPAWEYRVEAGQGADSAAWDVQVLPGRGALAEQAGLPLTPWEATALLRWVRPRLPEAAAAAEVPPGPLRWADLLGLLPVADARLLVQNVLSAGSGGAAASAALFFDTVHLAGAAGSAQRVRHVPQDGLPLALLQTLFGRRVWAEVERARRFLPLDRERQERRAQAFEDLDLRLAEGRLAWSDGALDLWQRLYRAPRHAALSQELERRQNEDRWHALLAGPARRVEALLRDLDVTDAALCLRRAPDERWRRYVTARREAELREELAFVAAWEARGELSLDRELDAWRCFAELAEREIP